VMAARPGEFRFLSIAGILSMHRRLPAVAFV
jgi:hypothetical protein